MTQPTKDMRKYLAQHPEEHEKFRTIIRKKREESWQKRQGSTRSAKSTMVPKTIKRKSESVLSEHTKRAV